jgi:hypothetical protein
MALIQLEKELVYGSPIVCNRDYEGEIANYGESVKIHGVSDPTISSYSQDTSMGSPQVLSDFEKVLTISQADAFNFAVDDIQTKQMQPKLMGQAMVRAAYKLANTADTYVAGVLAAAVGTTATDANWTSTAWDGSTSAPVAISPAAFSDPTAGEAAYEFLVDLGVYLDQVAVPREDRYVIVPPFFTGLLAKDLRFTGYEGYGQGTVLTDGFAAQPGKNGFAGRVAGFNVIGSLNVPTGTFTTPTSSSPYLGTDGSSATYYKVIAGVPSATSFANQIIKTETFRNPNYFADQVRGLHVYGTEVVWPERLVGAYIAQGVATTH